MTGANKVTPNPKASPNLFFELTFIDWDHSLVMAIFWSLLWGLICWRFYQKNKKIGIVAAIASFSHFLLDLPVHNADLALYPYSKIKLGFGLWEKLGIWAWVLEIVFMFVLLVYAWIRHKRRGENIWMQAALVCLLAVQMSPWLSPMKTAAGFSGPMVQISHGFLTLIGYVIPGIILIWMYKRSSAKAEAKLSKQA